MITPDKSAEESNLSTEPETSDNEQCVPAAALAADGTPPAVGDEVEYTIKGKVTRVEGEMAYVDPASCNDQPIAQKPAGPDTQDDVMDAAKKADAEMEA